MQLAPLVIATLSCLVLQPAPDSCLSSSLAQVQPAGRVAGIEERVSAEPVLTGDSLDVVLTAEAALAWDWESGKILYERNADARRPIASLSKLFSALLVRDQMQASAIIEIPASAADIQRRGAHIGLPPGQHATVRDLLAASLVASANDAMHTLAVAAFGSEEVFVERANFLQSRYGLLNTRVANSTGLEGGDQYSTARDVQQLLQHVHADPILRVFLSSQNGILETMEGRKLQYKTTNRLLGTYVPVIAAKTGFTTAAGENLAMITMGRDGQKIGAIILGSKERFQDMKTLVEWIQRQYRWPAVTANGG